MWVFRAAGATPVEQDRIVGTPFLFVNAFEVRAMA